jgi:hypothetical protein
LLHHPKDPLGFYTLSLTFLPVFIIESNKIRLHTVSSKESLNNKKCGLRIRGIFSASGIEIPFNLWQEVNIKRIAK